MVGVNILIGIVWSAIDPFVGAYICVRITEDSDGLLVNEVYDLRFGMYFLYMWCTREWWNQFGLTPNCRDSRINDMFRNTYPMLDN